MFISSTMATSCHMPSMCSYNVTVLLIAKCSVCVAAMLFTYVNPHVQSQITTHSKLLLITSPPAFFELSYGLPQLACLYGGVA